MSDCRCGSGQTCTTAPAQSEKPGPTNPEVAFSDQLLAMFSAVLGTVMLLVVLAEWLGLLDRLTDYIPWPVWIAAIAAGGYPIFRAVLRAARNRRVTSHTPMTVGLIAAIAVGAWPAGVLVVFFMRLADYIEHFTVARAHRAVRDLTAMAPDRARVERDGSEIEMPASKVRIDETVIVRPGERIPVDGEVIGGQATVDQAAITGESMPVEAGPGARVFAASFARLGHLQVRAIGVGADTTFGRVIKLVEEAENHRADVQRIADRFATWYLPVVAAIAAATLVVSGNALATASVLMVACSCSFALATPVAMIASIGASARRGLLIKGGKYLEALAKADVVLIDKTGTLTLGRPEIADIVVMDDAIDEDCLLMLAASAERYSEHPLAEALRGAAGRRGLMLQELEQFKAIPGLGVRAHIDGAEITVGSQRLLREDAVWHAAAELKAQGKTLLFVERDGKPLGVLAAMDTLRPETPSALAELRNLGIKHIELLTGDNEETAAAIAGRLGIAHCANLLPEDKIAIVKVHQREGRIVVMIGDGVNDAPALAQADVGIAMGAAGSPVAIEAGHIALMREDWRLVPEVLRVARRTMGAVRFNLGFTAIYNLTGLSLATAGVLPPVIAAAAQSLPDFGILGNSARLLRQRRYRSSQQKHGAAVDPVRSSDSTPALRQGVQAT
jgi:Cd2+/Zn2+-exporting ATPase/Cu+-exporting ATPase